jgi:DNA-binding MarR family transcriptional regulator
MQTTSPVSAAQLADEIARFLAGAMRTAQSEVFALVGELELSMTQLKILHILDGMDHEPTPSEVAEHVGLSPAAAGRAVDHMTRSGLVSRREDADDRRVKRLALTPAGADAIARMHAARLAGLSRLVAELEPEQRTALSTALAPLLTNVSGPIPNACATSPTRTEDPA